MKSLEMLEKQNLSYGEDDIREKPLELGKQEYDP